MGLIGGAIGKGLLFPNKNYCLPECILLSHCNFSQESCDAVAVFDVILIWPNGKIFTKILWEGNEVTCELAKTSCETRCDLCVANHDSLPKKVTDILKGIDKT